MTGIAPTKHKYSSAIRRNKYGEPALAMNACGKKMVRIYFIISTHVEHQKTNLFQFSISDYVMTLFNSNQDKTVDELAQNCECNIFFYIEIHLKLLMKSYLFLMISEYNY